MKPDRILASPCTRRVFVKAAAGAAAPYLAGRPAAASPRIPFEVSASLYAWDLHDEGIERILDNLQEMAAVNSVYLVALMHYERRPLTSPRFPHNPARTMWQAEDSRGKECGFIASGTGADLEDDVLLVVGVLGQEKDLELGIHGGELLLERVQLLLGVGAHFEIGFGFEHGARVTNAGLKLLVLLIFIDDGNEFALGLGGLLIVGRVVDDFGRGEGLVKFFPTGLDLS